MLAALRARPLPGWFDDAKLGIFIHWGLFSVPGFAARVEPISDAFRLHYDRAVVMTPYTEWYENALRVPGSPSARFHQEHYPGRSYASFREDFLAGLGQWDPADWARLFRSAGAGYVVLVTKHHDGFCLWPSGVPHPHRRDWCSPRDVVGELARAVRAEGLRFGVYYSGGIDWSFNPRPVRTLAQFMGSVPKGAYPAYAEAQIRELISRVQPSVLWNDIAWPGDRPSLLQLLADYYAAVPEGVVNDRWMHRSWALRLLGHRLVQRGVDALLRRQIARAAARGERSQGIVPPRPLHYDFRTPEYTQFDEITSRKWEATRGMSASFGYNRRHGEKDYERPEELIRSFVDIASKNGNLLLNVGPRGEDAAIPEPQRARLLALGAWLRTNGAALYGTRPWQRAAGETREGLELRFTRRGGTLYVLLLGTPTAPQLTIRDLRLPTGVRVRRVADGAPLRWRQDGPDLHVELSQPLEPAPAHALRIEGGASS